MPQRRNTTAVTVKEEELKGYLHDIADFRRGRIIRKGREVKNDIVYVEKGSDGFLSDRVRIRPTAARTATTAAASSSYNDSNGSGGGVQSWSQLQKLGRRIWVAKEILMCSGQMNCQRECGGMGRCKDDCLKKDEKRAKSGHRCSFRVNMRMYLHNIGHWEVDVTGRHVPPNVNWVPPKKNLVNKIKTNATRKNDRLSQCYAVAPSKTINRTGALADQDECYIDKKSSTRIGWTYPNNNSNNINNNFNNHSFPPLYSTASIIAVPNLNQIHQVEDQALDLTQNHRTLNFTPDKGSTKESRFSCNKFLRNNQFPVTVTPKVEQQTESPFEGRSEKANDILTFVKDTVRQAKDNMEAFVIVSTAPNQFSFWGTSQFLDKFKSTEPLVPYDPRKCHNTLELDRNLLTRTAMTPTSTTTTGAAAASNKTNRSHSTGSKYERDTEQQYLGKKQNCLKIPSPYSFKHSTFFFTNLLQKQSATSAGAVVQVPGFNTTNNSGKHKIKALKGKSSIQDTNIGDNQEKVTSKCNGDDCRDVDSEEEDESPKENVVVTLMQKERSQALLRILKSRRNKAGKNLKFGANMQNGLA